MVRHYKRKHDTREYRSYQDEDLELAVKTIRQGMTQRKAQEVYKIPRWTFANKLKGIHAGKVGHPTALRTEEKALVCQYLETVAD